MSKNTWKSAKLWFSQGVLLKIHLCCIWVDQYHQVHRYVNKNVAGPKQGLVRLARSPFVAASILHFSWINIVTSFKFQKMLVDMPPNLIAHLLHFCSSSALFWSFCANIQGLLKDWLTFPLLPTTCQWQKSGLKIQKPQGPIRESRTFSKICQLLQFIPMFSDFVKNKRKFVLFQNMYVKFEVFEPIFVVFEAQHFTFPISIFQPIAPVAGGWTKTY